MKAKTSYWKARIPWYPEGCFGPYRSPNIGYSRRELLADGLVHALGLLGFGVASWRLLWTLDPDLPADLRAAIVTYTVSIMTMLICSSMWNGLAWDRGHRRLLLRAGGGDACAYLASTARSASSNPERRPLTWVPPSGVGIRLT